MIYQNDQTENTQNKFSKAISELKLGKLLRASNITKNCGIPAYEVFQFLLLLVFQGKNLFRFLNSKHKDQAVSKNTYYRFLSDPSYNWKKFLLLLAAKVTSAFDKLTRRERVKVLILDDPIIKRNRSKKVELLARVYDMKLGTEFQSRTYDAMVSHTTIVFTRYIILEWMHRNENDQKTYGELFFMLCDDIQDMDLTNALQGLMSLFTDIVAKVSADITELVKSKIEDWMKSQPMFIQALFGDLCWES